jgi:hypothetical protein
VVTPFNQVVPGAVCRVVVFEISRWWVKLTYPQDEVEQGIIERLKKD